MKKKIKIIFIIILVISIIISIIFIINRLVYKSKINNVIQVYDNENVQERLQDKENQDDLLLQIDGKTVLGVIKIDKINFEGLVYEGTSLEILSKGVGHFENSPYLQGNVCLAAHNTKNFWENLNKLEKEDKITYISFLGTKEYKVENVEKILETDWSLLENTNENKLTLITCVKGQKTQRLCVIAKESI